MYMNKLLSYKDNYEKTVITMDKIYSDTFEEGIKKFCEWVLTQPLEQDNYKKSLEEMKNKGLYK